MPRFLKRPVALGALLALTLLSAHSYAAPVDDVTAATTDLYARITARDLAGVAQYLPPAGFTEIAEGADAPHRLDAKAFAAFFNAPVDIDFKAIPLDVQVLSDTAIVVGKRVGAVSPKGKPAAASTVLFTAVWRNTAGHWQLQHLHLSPINSAVH